MGAVGLKQNSTPSFSISERDLDLLIMDLLAFDTSFANSFLKKLALSQIVFTSIEHSVYDNFGGDAWGETDILIRLENGAAILLENKLTAPFQPDQAARYRARARHYDSSEQAALTVLIAPRAYLLSVDPTDWDTIVSYSEISEIITANEPRGNWRKSLFLESTQRASKVKNLLNSKSALRLVRPEIIDFKKAWRAELTQSGVWQANVQTGGGDEFLYRLLNNPFGLTVWHHPLAGYLSVQIPAHLATRVQDSLAKGLPENMRLTQHPSSVYLDVSVPPIDMSVKFEIELQNVLGSMALAGEAIEIIEAVLSPVSSI